MVPCMGDERVAATGEAASTRRSGVLVRRPRRSEASGHRHLEALAAHFDDHGLAVGEVRHPRTARVRLDPVVELGLDPAGVHGERLVGIGRSERGIVEDGPVERDRSGQTVHLELGQRAARPLDGLGPGRARDHELCQQGVEVLADDAALLDAGLDPDAGTTRRPEHRDRSRCRQEVAARILPVDAEVDRMTPHRRVVVAECGTVGDAHHLADQVDAGDLLGDGVLDLQACVDLEERDRAVLTDEELAGAGTDVTRLFQDRLGRRVEQCVLLVGQLSSAATARPTSSAGSPMFGMFTPNLMPPSLPEGAS
jgi:hypothetical protein